MDAACMPNAVKYATVWLYVDCVTISGVGVDGREANGMLTSIMATWNTVKTTAARISVISETSASPQISIRVVPKKNGTEVTMITAH